MLESKNLFLRIFDKHFVSIESIMISLLNFDFFFTLELPGVTQENAFQRGKNPSPIFPKTID